MNETETAKKVQLNRACNSKVPCSALSNLACANGRCMCNNVSILIGSMCAIPKVSSIHQGCSQMAPCDSRLGLTCINGTCTCGSRTYFNGTLCGK